MVNIPYKVRNEKRAKYTVLSIATQPLSRQWRFGINFTVKMYFRDVFYIENDNSDLI